MDSNNIYVKFYQLAQEMLSLEDTAMHQSVGDTGITVLGRGVLSKYGKNLEDMVDDLLVNHSDVPSVEKTGDVWADKFGQDLKNAKETINALQKRVSDLKDEKDSLEVENSTLKTQLKDAQANGNDSSDLIAENSKLKSENESLRKQNDSLMAQLSEKTGEDKAAADSKIDAADNNANSSATAPSDEKSATSASAADLMGEDATNGDKSIIDGAIDDTAAADNSASESDASDDGDETLDVAANLASAEDSLNDQPAPLSTTPESDADDGLNENDDDSEDGSGEGSLDPNISLGDFENSNSDDDNGNNDDGGITLNDDDMPL